MQLVEQHCISTTDPRYAIIDKAAFASKNLYNAALYDIRQSFIHEGTYLNYNAMDKRMQAHEAYKALPAKVSQQVLKLLDKNWKSFFEALNAYKEDPSKFKGRPKFPSYKDKVKGRNVLVYTIQALGKGKDGLKGGFIKPSLLGISVKTRQHPETINQVRIVPRKGFYTLEVIYEHEQPKSAVDPASHAGIDIGIDNLAALTSNLPGFVPVLVNGRPVKSVNHYYNKSKAELQNALGRTGTTKRMERLTNKRNRRIDHYMHTASRWIVDDLVAHGIGSLVIGKNEEWKQAVNLGKQNNQNFVSIPHARFISMLTYKAERAGIRVKLTEESYTSVASFLDRDPLPTWQANTKTTCIFSGKRVKRGLYRAADGTHINADCNGSYNIIRKVAPDAFGSKGVEDAKGHNPVVHPVRLSFPHKPKKGNPGLQFLASRYETL